MGGQNNLYFKLDGPISYTERFKWLKLDRFFIKLFSKQTANDVELTVSIDESGRSANVNRVKSTQIIYKNGHFDQNFWSHYVIVIFQESER